MAGHVLEDLGPGRDHGDNQAQRRLQLALNLVCERQEVTGSGGLSAPPGLDEEVATCMAESPVDLLYPHLVCTPVLDVIGLEQVSEETLEGVATLLPIDD